MNIWCWQIREVVAQPTDVAVCARRYSLNMFSRVATTFVIHREHGTKYW